MLLYRVRIKRQVELVAPAEFIEPSLRRGRPAQEAFGAQILIDLGPMDAVAAAGQLPVRALGGGGVEQARVPASGTAMVRPSIRSTASRSSSQATPATRQRSVPK
jgi:hypothetical protein